MSVLRVALDIPLPRLFDYLYPSADSQHIGHRAIVPFGKGRRLGIVVEVSEHSEIPSAKLRSAEVVLDDMPALSEEWLALARFCSDYYQRPLGEVIHAALPPRLRRPQVLKRAPRTFVLTETGTQALGTTLRSKAQQHWLQQFAERGTIEAGEIPAALRRALLNKAWIAEPAHGAPQWSFVSAHALLEAQQQAVDTIAAALGRYQPFVLLGVTGSGKTEVYLNLVAATLRRGEQALILVPEINLTPQLEAQFRTRLPGANIVTLTSALADNERAHAWLAAQAGEAQVVLGTRLAIFAALPRLGLIIVDEEHDSSFKQQEGVRYSARDLAIFRASKAQTPVVLGSATPSLESFAQARSGRYQLLELPQRAHKGATLPTVEMLDMRSTAVGDGLAEPLVAAIEARLARGEQSLLFLNRRGYAPVLVCAACAWTSGCPRCSANLIVHLRQQRLRCHHCGYVAPVPRHCPQCGNVDLLPLGSGTQRLEETIAKRFPQARALRIDSDSTRGKGRWDSMRAQIEAGEVDLLIGTQILAKGHDFPRLTLVGVLNADSALLAPDYRAPERLFAQLYQVAGRAGRADLPGEVLIQTRYPQHPLYQALARHDFAAYASTLLAEREQAGFPPYVYEAVLRAESRDMNESIGFLQNAVALAPLLPEEIVIFDAVPMSLSRLNGWERAHVLLQASSRRTLQNFLHEWSHALYAMKPGAARWHLEVDPLEF